MGGMREREVADPIAADVVDPIVRGDCKDDGRK
jgi:hypothetical protein